MRLCVGPVAPKSVLTWAKWARSVLQDLRNDPNAGVCLSARVLDDIEAYVTEWEHTTGRRDGSFRWDSEVEPEDLEYLTNALYNLDLRLIEDGDRRRRVALPAEGRVFHLILVRAMLASLALESATHAAFVDQMRASWPNAAEAL